MGDVRFNSPLNKAPAEGSLSNTHRIRCLMSYHGMSVHEEWTVFEPFSLTRRLKPFAIDK
jgi:hypothetical protein